MSEPTEETPAGYLELMEGNLGPGVRDLRVRGTLKSYPAGTKFYAECDAAHKAEQAAQTPEPVAPAFKQLKQALQADGVEAGSYAWAWLCNLAMPIMDSTKVSHEQANRAAAVLMRHIFDIDMTTAAEWVRFEERWKDATPEQAAPLPQGADALHSALERIVTAWEARSELFTNDEDCAGTLADIARAAIARSATT